MGDLKSFWPNPGGDSNPGLDGDTITGRGTDPMVTIDSPNGLADPIWPNPPVPLISGEETDNSVSGLPSTPNRFEPTATPPEPPSLKDRNPGTIDER